MFRQNSLSNEMDVLFEKNYTFERTLDTVWSKFAVLLNHYKYLFQMFVSTITRNNWSKWTIITIHLRGKMSCWVWRSLEDKYIPEINNPTIVTLWFLNFKININKFYSKSKAYSSLWRKMYPIKRFY